MLKPLGSIAIASALGVLALTAGIASACTGIRLTAKDGSIVYARTLEFGCPLNSQILFLPRGHEFIGTTASARPGLAWCTKYAAIGLNGEGLDILVDGVNEHGLAAGGFYFPGYAGYQPSVQEEEAGTIAPWEVMTWMLTNFKTVDEIRDALPGIRVSAATINATLGVPPLHFVAHDASGKSLVVEYVDGKLTTFDNPIGVITNSPTFDWHLTNLRNYINLTAVNVPPVELDGVTLEQLGQGSGLQGLPGDFTPPSRFVRAVALSRSAEAGETGADAVREAFHVLDSFDIPRGVVRADAAPQDPMECTQWTSAADLKNHKYYFHTYGNRRVRSVDLARFDVNAKQPVSIPLGEGDGVEALEPPVVP
jgi:choloylglycine hydrolase